MREKSGVPIRRFTAGLIVTVLAFSVVSSVCPLAFAAPGWSRTFGWAGDDTPQGGPVQTLDGGYLISGYTNSSGAGSYDALLVKIDAFGYLEWNKTYGGSLDDRGKDVCNTPDGGFALCGFTNSFGVTSQDFWLIKVNPTGNVQWNKTYGTPATDNPYAIVQTTDGGYAMVGTINSPGATSDSWLVKTDANGNMQWNRTYGGIGNDALLSIVQISEGGYVMAGWTNSSGAGNNDAWLIKTDSFGNIVWNRTYGGSASDQGWGVVQTTDGGYAVLASTSSSGAGGSDVWLFKTDALGTMQWSRTFGGAGADHGSHCLLQTSEGEYVLGSSTQSFGAGARDVWLIETDGSGRMMWNKTYGGTGSEAPVGLIQSSDGGFMVVASTESFGFGRAGSSTVLFAGINDILVIKTDEAGVTPALPAATAFTSVTVMRGWTWWFFVHSNGGAGAYTYQWYENTTLLQGQTSMVLAVTKTVAGTYTFYCKVTDAQGMAVNSNRVVLTVFG